MPEAARIDSIVAATTAKGVIDEIGTFPLPSARRSQQNAMKKTINVSEDLAASHLSTNRRLKAVIEQSYHMNHASGTANRIGIGVQQDAVCDETRCEVL